MGLATRTTGNALHPPRVQNRRLLALFGGHRLDDRLDTNQLAIVEFHAVGQRVREERQPLHHVAQAAHFLEQTDLLQEVRQGELARQQALGILLGLLLVDELAEIIHQADNVAHAQNAAGHALGAERLKLIKPFAHTHVLDRCARDHLDRQRRATAGIAIELGQHHPVDAHFLVEMLGRCDGVLADHRVDDQQHVVRRGLLADSAQLVHQLLIDGQAAGGIEDHHIEIAVFRLVVPGLAQLGRHHARHRVHWHIEPLAQDFQLIDSGRAVHVGSDEQHLFALRLEQIR